MKKILATTALAVALAWSGAALAQDVTVEIAPEKQTVIKEYVVKEKVAPVTIEGEIVVGRELPDSVTFQDVPEDWGDDLTKYKYVYISDKVVFVDPENRKIVHILEVKPAE